MKQSIKMIYVGGTNNSVLCALVLIFNSHIVNLYFFVISVTLAEPFDPARLHYLQYTRQSGIGVHYIFCPSYFRISKHKVRVKNLQKPALQLKEIHV